MAPDERVCMGLRLDHTELAVKDRALVLKAAGTSRTEAPFAPALRRPFLSGSVSAATSKRSPQSGRGAPGNRSTRRAARDATLAVASAQCASRPAPSATADGHEDEEGLPAAGDGAGAEDMPSANTARGEPEPRAEDRPHNASTASSPASSPLRPPHPDSPDEDPDLGCAVLEHGCLRGSDRPISPRVRPPYPRDPRVSEAFRFGNVARRVSKVPPTFEVTPDGHPAALVANAAPRPCSP